MSAKKKTNEVQDDSQLKPSINFEALARVAHDTRNVLAFHRELGLTHFPATEQLDQAFVKDLSTPAPVTPESIRKNPSPKNVSVSNPSRKSATRQLEIIGQNLASCRDCASASGAVILGQGSPAPRLFVVGDWYSGNEVQEGMLWGAEEDDLFWKMMAAIGLDMESVYVTNCIKCLAKGADFSSTEHGRACFSYLEQEILAIQPEIICVLGEVATGLLLKKKAPLVRLRGRFHRYSYPHGGEARVMATYHPRFLLQHEEMKKAAWLDLQTVQRNLPG